MGLVVNIHTSKIVIHTNEFLEVLENDGYTRWGCKKCAY